MRNWINAALISAILVSIPAVASAEAMWTRNATAMGFDWAPWEQYTFGTVFTVGDSAITVTKLAYADFGSDGLNGSHQVGIWDMSGTLLGSTTVPSGSTADISNEWNWVTLGTTITLSANTQYVLGADTSTGTNDYFRYGGLLATDWSDGIAAISHRRQTPAGGGFAFPTEGLTYDQAWLNTNMEYTIVPEPASMILLGLGGVGMLIRRKR